MKQNEQNYLEETNEVQRDEQIDYDASLETIKRDLVSKIDKADLSLLASGVHSLDSVAYSVFQRIKGISTDIGVNFNIIRSSCKKNILQNINVALPANVTVMVMFNPACDSNQLFVYDVTNNTVLSRQNLFTSYQSSYTCYQNTFWSIKAIQANDSNQNINASRLITAKIVPSETVWRSVASKLLEVQTPGGVSNVSASVGINMHAINSSKSSSNYLDPNNISIRTMYSLAAGTNVVYIPVNSTIIILSPSNSNITLNYIDPAGTVIPDYTITVAPNQSYMLTVRLAIYSITSTGTLTIWIEPPGEWACCAAILISAANVASFLSFTIFMDTHMVPGERLMSEVSLLTPRDVNTPVSIIRYALETTTAGIHTCDKADGAAWDFMKAVKSIGKVALEVAKPFIPKAIASIGDMVLSRKKKGNAMVQQSSPEKTRKLIQAMEQIQGKFSGYSSDVLSLDRIIRHTQKPVGTLMMKQYQDEFILVEEDTRMAKFFNIPNTYMVINVLTDFKDIFTDLLTSMLSFKGIDFSINVYPGFVWSLGKDLPLLTKRDNYTAVAFNYETDSNINDMSVYYNAVRAIELLPSNMGYAMDQPKTVKVDLYIYDQLHNPQIFFSVEPMLVSPIDGVALVPFNSEYTKQMKASFKPAHPYSYVVQTLFDLDKSMIGGGYAMDNVKIARKREAYKTTIGQFVSSDTVVVALEKLGYNLGAVDNSQERSSRAIKRMSKGNTGYQFFPVVYDIKNLIPTKCIRSCLAMTSMPLRSVEEAYTKFTINNGVKNINYYFDVNLHDAPNVDEFNNMCYSTYREHTQDLYFTVLGFDGTIGGRSFFSALMFLISDFPNGQYSSGSFVVQDNGTEAPSFEVNDLGGVALKSSTSTPGLPLIILTTDVVPGAVDGMDFFYNAAKRDKVPLIRCQDLMTQLYVGQMSLKAKAMVPLAKILGQNTSYYLDKLKAVPRNRLLLLGLSNLDPTSASAILYALGKSTAFASSDPSVIQSVSESIVRKCIAGFGVDVIIGSNVYPIRGFVDFKGYHTKDQISVTTIKNEAIQLGNVTVYSLANVMPAISALTSYTPLKSLGKKKADNFDTDLTDRYLKNIDVDKVLNTLAKRLIQGAPSNKVITRDEYDKEVGKLFPDMRPKAKNVKFDEDEPASDPYAGITDKNRSISSGADTNVDIRKIPNKTFVASTPLTNAPSELIPALKKILTANKKYSDLAEKDSLYGSLAHSWQIWFSKLAPILRAIPKQENNVAYVYYNLNEIESDFSKFAEMARAYNAKLVQAPSKPVVVKAPVQIIREEVKQQPSRFDDDTMTDRYEFEDNENPYYDDDQGEEEEGEEEVSGYGEPFIDTVVTTKPLPKLPFKKEKNPVIPKVEANLDY